MKIEPTLFASSGVRKEYGKTSWIRIGRLCSAGRRSMWARINYLDGSFNKPAHPVGQIKGIELCSGREGDDSYALITKDNPAFQGIYDIVTDLFFALESLGQGIDEDG